MLRKTIAMITVLGVFGLVDIKPFPYDGRCPIGPGKGSKQLTIQSFNTHIQKDAEGVKTITTFEFVCKKGHYFFATIEQDGEL